MNSLTIPVLKDNKRGFFGVDNVGIFYNIADITFNPNIKRNILRLKYDAGASHKHCIKCEYHPYCLPTDPCRYYTHPIAHEFETNTDIYGLNVPQQELSIRCGKRFSIIVSIKTFLNKNRERQSYLFIKGNPSHFGQKNNLNLTGENTQVMLQLLHNAIKDKLEYAGVELPYFDTKLNAVDLALNMYNKENIIKILFNINRKAILLSPTKNIKLSIYEKTKNVWRIEVRLISSQKIKKYFRIETLEQLYRNKEKYFFDVFTKTIHDLDLPYQLKHAVENINYFNHTGSTIRIKL